MPRFTVTPGSLGSLQTVVLTDAATGEFAQATLLGATLLNYSVAHHGGVFDVLAGYETEQALREGRMARSWIMAPWSNRIQHSRYQFDGKTYQLPVDPKWPHAIHGRVKDQDFEIVEQRGGDDFASVSLLCKALRPGRFEGYPFAVDVRVRFTLAASRLQLEISGTNVGDEPAPFGCGWHPYFRTCGEGIDHLQIGVPARRKIVPNPELIPLEGEQAYLAIAKAGELNFRPTRAGRGRAIPSFVDNAFADLAADSDGLCRSWILDRKHGLRLAVLQKGGLMHVFTGDRKSLAMEPVQVMTNAFNRPECAKAVTLNPGKTSTLLCGVEVRSDLDM